MDDGKTYVEIEMRRLIRRSRSFHYGLLKEAEALRNMCPHEKITSTVYGRECGDNFCRKKILCLCCGLVEEAWCKGFGVRNSKSLSCNLKRKLPHDKAKLVPNDDFDVFHNQTRL